MAQKSKVTLTQVTYLGRQFIKFGAIILVFLMVGRVALTSFIALWEATHPDPPPPPTVGFGTLPSLKFSQREDLVKPTSYLLETANGNLPTFADRAKVFLMPQSSLGLLADENARKIASNYDYLFEPEIQSSRIYRWTKSQPLASTLQVDIQSLAFKITTDYLSNPALLANPNLPDNFQAVSLVKKFLAKTSQAPDLATASGEVVYKKSLGGSLADAVSYSDADFIQVDLNRTLIDGQYRMYTPEGYKGVVHAIITGALSGAEGIVYFENNYHQVDYFQYHTYPLRPIKEAWQILKSGEGYIASFTGEQMAVIRNVSLGYYDDFQEQEYLQPIYVFTGDNDFVGYVSAVDSTYLQKNLTKEE